MDRFGFGKKPPMDYPAGQMSASGPRSRKGTILPMSSRSVDVGRTAIGQALLLVTPLQMATVAQTIGNGGVRMEPRLVAKVRRPRRAHDRRAAARGGRARHVRRQRRQAGDR